jgi:uncharacterized peroxidase-related enzyme
MVRLTAVDMKQASGKAIGLLGKIHATLGRTPNMMRTMAHSPAALEGYLGISQALKGGTLGVGLRQQIALAVGEANRCEYCVSAHTAFGRMVGLGDTEMVASRQAVSTDPKADAALKFARTLTERRGEVTDADIRMVREAGHTDGEIAEIIAHVALNIFTNYFNKSAAVGVDFPRVALGEKTLAVTG